MGVDASQKAGASERAHAAPQALLSAAIDACRRHLMFSALARRLLFVLAAAMFFPLVVVIADHTLQHGLPRPVIFGAGIVWGLATLSAAGGLSIRTLVRRWNRLFIARHLERVWQVAHNPLVNLVLLQRAPRAVYAREGAERQAALALAAAEPGAPGRAVSFRQPGLLLLAAVGVWLLYAGFAPKPVLPSLARFFGAGRPAPTATWLELLRPRANELVYAGEPLEMEFAIFGRSVSHVSFALLDPADHDAPPLLRCALQRSADSRAGDRRRITLAAHEVSGDVHYRCCAGDGVLQGMIPVQPQPDLAGLQIELEPPAYLGEPALRTTEPDLDIWAGTRATFLATANTEVLDPVFVLRGHTETRTRMSVDAAEPRRAMLSLRLTESGEYWIEFSDRHGRASCDPARHRVIVRHDSAPQVAITTPSGEEAPGDVVDVTYVARLRAVASDDVRLDGLFLVRQSDGDENRADLLDGQALSSGRDIEVEVATSDLPLEVGQSLQVWFEARDNRVALDGTAAPQTTRTRALTLVRTPEVVAEPTAASDFQPGGEGDATGLEGPTVARQRTVRSGATGDGEAGASVAAPDDSDDRNGAAGPVGGQYRRASGGADDQADDDADTPPEMLDPNWVDVVDDGDGASGEDAAPDAITSERSEAARAFGQELRRFGQEHGSEAREVSKSLGSRPDDESADESQPQDGGSGGGAADDSPQQDSPPGPDTASGLDQAAEQPPPDAVSPDGPPPESQPVEPEQGEVEQPDEQTTAERATGREEPARREPGDEPAKDVEPRERQPTPEVPAKTTPTEQGRPESQEPDQPRGDRQQSAEGESKRADADAQDQQPDESSGQSQQRDAVEREDTPAQGAVTDDDTEQREGGEPEQAVSGGQPDLERGDRVVPLAGGRGATPIEPPSEPDTTGGAGDVESPADSGPRVDVVDTLELLRRVDDISDEQLTELGWPPEKRRAFLRDLERLRAAARRAGVLSQLKWWQAQVELGSAEVQAGAALVPEISTGVAGADSVRDGLEKIAPPRRQRVPPELETVLDAYYRALAEERTRQRESSAGSP